MTKEQTERLKDVVATRLESALFENPAHWACVLTEHLDKTGKLLEYLDFSNLPPEEQAEIVEELGFNPTKQNAQAKPPTC